MNSNLCLGSEFKIFLYLPSQANVSYADCQIALTIFLRGGSSLFLELELEPNTKDINKYVVLELSSQIMVFAFGWFFFSMLGLKSLWQDSLWNVFIVQVFWGRGCKISLQYPSLPPSRTIVNNKK